MEQTSVYGVVYDKKKKNTKNQRSNLGRDKTRIRMRMADTDGGYGWQIRMADEKIRMRKCGWRIKRG